MAKPAAKPTTSQSLRAKSLEVCSDEMRVRLFVEGEILPVGHWWSD